MTKYLLVNRSASPFNPAALPKAQVIQLMEAWGEWLGSLGSAVVDEGNAVSAGGKRVSTNGIVDGDDHLAGYTVIEAKNFDEALAIAKTSPIIQRGGNVEVYEAFGI